jgi:hypothetical protein
MAVSHCKEVDKSLIRGLSPRLRTIFESGLVESARLSVLKNLIS